MMSLSIDKAQKFQTSNENGTKSPMSPATPQSAEDMIIDYTEMEQYMKQDRLGVVDEDMLIQVPVTPAGPPKTPQAPVDFMLDFEDMEEYLDSKRNSNRQNKDDTDEEKFEEAGEKVVNVSVSVPVNVPVNAPVSVSVNVPVNVPVKKIDSVNELEQEARFGAVPVVTIV